MYQSVYFDRNPGPTQWHYFLRDDLDGITNFKYFPPVYKLDEYGEHETLFGDRCSLVTGKYDKSDPDILEKDIDREIVVLRDLYYQTDNMPKYQNILDVDIEIEIIGPLNPTTIREANAEITSIALINFNTKEKICLILDKKKTLTETIRDGKKIIPCLSEIILLRKFLDIWEDVDPTIVVGWNSDFFDIPYLYYRIKMLLGNQVYRLSPIGKIDENIYSPENPINIGLVNCLDYMLLMKKYMMKEEPSYKLGDIGSKYVKLNKIEYDGNLDKLFVEDINKFIDYNIRDVEIIEALEDKFKFIELTILICHLCHIPYESIYYNTSLNEGAILTYLKRKGIVSPNKPTTTNPSIKELNIGDHIVHQRGTPTIEGIITDIRGNQAVVNTMGNSTSYRDIKTIKKKDSYAGGYLLDPVPGLYSDLSDLDFTSLYPSIIKSLNLGVETLIGRIVTKDNYEQNNSLEKLKERDKNEEIAIERLNKHYELEQGYSTIGQLIRMIEENNWSISASGAFFMKDKKSITCVVLEDWFNKREHYRKLKKEAGNLKDWNNYKLYDLYQLAFKILQNALYGTYAINSWRYTDGHKICSSATTNSGQRLTQESIIFVDNYISKQLGVEDKKFVRASDTDSLYMELTELLIHRNPDLDYSNRKLKVEKLLLLTDELQREANINLNSISKDLFNISDKHYFELKQEVIAEKAYWAGKRRYAMYIVNKEGVEIEELDMKGLDIMKSNFPALFRNFGEQLLKDILFSVPKEEIDKKIIEFKKDIHKVDWKQLIKPTGVKKIDEYIEAKPKPGEIFSKIRIKCPINTKGAIISNDLIRFKKLQAKYPEFRIGDKMFIVYLKDNPYKLQVLGLNGYNDPPELLELSEQYIDRDLLFESTLKNKIESLYKDIGWGPVIFNPKFSKFFTFS
jgi:DNA polymerase elongation subunit (family B)